MNWREERLLARTTDNPSEYLNHPNYLVREGLLDNPNTDSILLEKLSKDKNVFIREKLAKRYLDSAIYDSNWRVRYAAIHDNFNVPIKVLKKLMDDSDFRVREEALRLLDINKNYSYRENYDNLITIKLVLPGTCNAKCKFCYNKYIEEMKLGSKEMKEKFLNKFLISLEKIVLKVDGKQRISLDITGNEPTLDTDFFIQVIHKLRNSSLKDSITRVTCTTNGIGILKVAPYMKGVVNYVNISVHDYDYKRRSNIFGTYFPTDDDYKKIVKSLLDNDISVTAVSVIHKKIDNFSVWRDQFISWALKIGFVGLRFRYDAYDTDDNNLFLDYMNQTIQDNNYYVIQKENAFDSIWCMLSYKSNFLVYFLYFLNGGVNTYDSSPGIEFVIHDDGEAYADFNKTVLFDDYKFPVGYIFDKI